VPGHGEVNCNAGGALDAALPARDGSAARGGFIIILLEPAVSSRPLNMSKLRGRQKAFVIYLCRRVAEEMKPHGIRVVR